MSRKRHAKRATLLGVLVLAASLLTATPAQAAAGCSSLSYGYQNISGNCRAANPAKSPYVKIGYTCWGTSHTRSISVNVGTGRKFDVGTTGCGVFAITGVWLVG